MKRLVLFTLFFLAAVSMLAQTQSPAPVMDVQFSNTLAQLERAAQDTNVALARLRIDKWKTDGTTKQQTQSNVESLQRNLSYALPELTGRVRQAPQDLTANFRLYRNVNTLYDVVANVTETAGAFGPKEQYEGLVAPVGILDQVRRSLGDRMDQLTQAKESELVRLRSQPATNTPQTSSIPKKTIVDDNEPASKPKKTKPKKPTATQPTQPSPQ